MACCRLTWMCGVNSSKGKTSGPLSGRGAERRGAQAQAARWPCKWKPAHLHDSCHWRAPLKNKDPAPRPLGRPAPRPPSHPGPPPGPCRLAPGARPAPDTEEMWLPSKPKKVKIVQIAAEGIVEESAKPANNVTEEELPAWKRFTHTSLPSDTDPFFKGLFPASTDKRPPWQPEPVVDFEHDLFADEDDEEENENGDNQLAAVGEDIT